MRKTLLALRVVAGCADKADDNVPPDSGGGGGDDTQRDYDDVATSLGVKFSAGDLAAMMDAVNLAYGRMPAGFTVTQHPTYQLVEGTREGLVIQYKLYCRDEAMVGVPCDGLAFRAHVRPTYAGTLGGPNADMDAIQRTAAWIVRDLTLQAPDLGGSGTDTFASHLSTGDYVLVINDTASHVRFASTPAGPMGGSIQFTINVERTRASTNPAIRTFDVTAALKFDGTDIATLTLDATQVYRLTISTGAVVKAK